MAAYEGFAQVYDRFMDNVPNGQNIYRRFLKNITCHIIQV